jgi:acylphosphatase
MPDKQGIQAIVSGRVQGVFFRAETQKKALSLQLLGEVCNQPNGAVSVYAYGSKSALNDLITWLDHGPMLARVDHLAVKWLDALPDPIPQTFRITG